MLQERTETSLSKSHPTITITSVLVGAIGGQGGNVLVEWLFLAAEKDGKRAQALSLPGLSQRGGGTTFYLEIASLSSAVWVQNPREELDKAVFGQHPFPGRVDVLIGQELLELGRMLQQGYASRRTTVIASRQRLYTIGEKTPAFDGIFPSERIIEATAKLSGAFSIIDTLEVARQNNLGELAANAILLGAISAMPGALPISVGAYRTAIQDFGLAVEMNLKAFEIGREFQLAELKETESKVQEPEPVVQNVLPFEPKATRQKRQITLTPITKPANPKKPDVPELIRQRSEALPAKERKAFAKLAAEICATYPEALHVTLIEAIYQMADYQDMSYARRYLKQVESIFKLDTGQAYTLTDTYARALAMRATYEDAVRVACLKIQQARFSRVQQEMQVKPGQMLILTDYLKPDAAEIYGIMPAFLVNPLLFMGKITGIGRWAEKKHFTLQLHPRTNSFSGYATFAFLTWFKPLRPVSHRAAQEWKFINVYTKQVAYYAGLNYELAVAIAESGKLLKGYGDTRRKMVDATGRYFTKVVQPVAKWEEKHQDNQAYPLTLAIARRGARLIGQDDKGIGWAEQLAEWAVTEAKSKKPISQIITEIEAKARVLSSKP